MKNLILIILTLLSTTNLIAASISGNVTDRENNEPLPYVTVQVVGSGHLAMVNFNGNYELKLNSGSHQLKFSHIGYYSEIKQVEISDTNMIIDISLQPDIIMFSAQTVYDRQYDEAQIIILEAIRRKQAILNHLHDCNYHAYSKLVIRDETNPDSAEIMIITETQSTAFWENPDKFKLIIDSRRQTANFPSEFNIIAQDEVLNFNKNRIKIGKYDVVSPVAEDALEYYDYYLVDSTSIDQLKVYRLEVEPKSNSNPLCVGFIQIVDSTYDIISVDVGFNKAVETSIIDNIHYQQRCALFDNEYWMPVTVSFTADIKIYFPTVPSLMSIDYIASLYDYEIEQESQEDPFDEYYMEVAENVDDLDSSDWDLAQSIPLTYEELHGYQYIDSVENAPKPVLKQAGMVALGLMGITFGGDGSLFHYNRVEGAYLGLKFQSDKLIPRTEFWLSSGYAFSAKYTQHQYGFSYKISDKYKLYAGAEYKRKITYLKQVNVSWFNSSFETLMSKYDPFDYYRENGFQLFAATKIIPHFKLGVSYQNYEQKSISVNTNYSIFDNDKAFRINPGINDGQLKTLSAEITYDSRKIWKNKGKDEIMDSPFYTKITLSGEYSDPDMLHSDFEYRRYSLKLVKRQRTGDFGWSTLNVFAGYSTRYLPTQEFYNLRWADYMGMLSPKFVTLGEMQFSGDRLYQIFLNHDFGRYLFTKSGIPLIKDIPFTLSVQGGAFWTQFHDYTERDQTYWKNVAEKPYIEVGFGVGNLTPFLRLFNTKLTFLWQLSDYDTNNFSLYFGFDI